MEITIKIQKAKNGFIVKKGKEVFICPDEMALMDLIASLLAAQMPILG
jgi:hypothetical protein